MIPHITPDLDTHRVRFWRTDLTELVHANPTAFAQMVKRQRKALGFSQRELARRCSVSFGAIGDLERCKYSSVTTHTIREVMDALALTVDDLRAEVAAMDDRRGHDIPHDLNGLEISHARYDNLRQEAA